MSRTWPFEAKGEPQEPFHDPQDFVRRQGAGVEAVVVRIGAHDAQLVLVDSGGRWERWVYASEDHAQHAAQALDLPVHTGHYPEDLRVRMNAYVRPLEDFERGAYREQGRVGPVISYPENRPRRVARPEEPVDDASEEWRSRHPGLSS
ncbi:hypothetical protein BH24ACT26_BH24ACT26_19140 [soil metagenome]